jgi:uncharacterized protein YjbI with pentapeptide repeats
VKWDFSGFDLRGAVFAAGDLRECVFTRAILDGTVFYRCILKPDQITSAGRWTLLPQDVMTGAVYVNRGAGVIFPRRARDYSHLIFSEMDLTGWDFAKADLRGTRFYGVNLTGVDFTSADIRGVHFHGSIAKEQLLATRSFAEGSLVGTVFLSVDFSGINLARQDLTGARFMDCDLSQVNITDAVITDVDFHVVAKYLSAERIKTTWNYKQGRMAGVKLPPEIRNAIQAK